MEFDPADIYERFQDHMAFCRESLSIEDDSGRVVPMELWPSQRKLHDAVQRQRRAGKPVRIIYLKSRRVGVSAATAAQYFHSTPFQSGQHCAVIAHDQQTANNLFGFYATFSRRYKPFGGVIKLPQMVKDAEGSVGWANGSWVRVSTARNVNFGRSFNLRRVQLDEFAFYDDPGKLMTSIMAAVPKDADTMVIIPSTANGVGNEFHKLWLRASDPANHSEWLAVFFAWWEHPANRLPLAIPGDRFQHSLDAEEREIKAKYNLDLEQLNWRRWVIENDFHGDVGKFRQEHPGCPEEAFIASGRLRFDVQAIGRMPVQRDAVQGGLEEIHVGIEKRLAFLPRERGELTLFRRPQPGQSYVIGADTSEGIDANAGEGEADPDYSVGQVLNRDTGEQVAIVRARMQPAAFGAYLWALATYYNCAAIVPEVNAAGIGVVDELLRRGYPARLLYHRRREADRDPWERADLIGWKTTTVTRPQLLSHLDTALREAAIAIHDPVTVQELMTFVIHPNGKAEATRGCHDDTVIALALAVVGIEQMPLTPVREPKRAPKRGDNPDRGRILKLLR
jgi:hypothetical protein